MAHATLLKFGYPHTLLHQGEHWALLARPAQVTLGSLVLCSTSEARSYADLPIAAFVEQAQFVGLAERILRDFVQPEKVNYLMLMMVDPHVHFHIIPRYSQRREHEGTSFPDSGWPGLPDLGTTSPLLDSTLAALKRLAESSVAD